MPFYFYGAASRIDHILSAMLPETVDKLNISESFNLTLRLPIDENGVTSISVNGITATLPLSFEVNYGNFDQISVDYGITSICSLYKNNLNTFAQKPVELSETLKQENSLNQEVLLVAECSDTPRLAIFVGFKNNSNDFSHIKVYVAGSFFTILSGGEPMMDFNGEQHNLRESTFEYPPFQSDFK